jgi:ADP-heptose:LPS heptosyltransferase
LMSTARPLVMRCGAFGDIVLLTVLIRQLHLRFGQPVDVIASGPWTDPLLEGESAVGRLFLLRSRRTPYWLSWQQHELVRWLRERGSGPVWYCDRGEGLELLARAGVPKDHIVDNNDFKFLPSETFTDRYLRLGGYSPRAFEGQLPEAQPGIPSSARLQISPASTADLDAWLAQRGLSGRQFMVIHPGSRHIARRWFRPRSGTSKYWPEERWAKVVQAVREHLPSHAIVFSGTQAEGRFIAEIVRRAGVADAFNASDDLPIHRLLPLFQRAHSVIGADSGPGHAAAALGCPTVSLFGTAGAMIYRPGGTLTPGVSLTGVVDGKQNIMGITPEMVITTWRQLVRDRTAA